MNSTEQFLDPNYAPDMAPVKGRGLIILAHVCIVVHSVALVLRLWSRATLPRGKRFQADDWTAVAAWPFVIGIPVVALYTMRHGFGHHVEEVPLGNLNSSLKVLFVGILCFYIGMTFIRISATLFYRRTLASHGRRFRQVLWANIVLNVLYMVAMIPVVVTTCDPVHAFWDRGLPQYKCRSAGHMMNSAGVVAALFDVITLILPLPIIMRLKLDWQKKLLVCGIFILGYSVVVFSIGRAVIMYKLGSSLDRDVTWSLVSAKYWIDLEVAVAFLGICLPAIFALCKRGMNHGLASLFNSREYRKPPPPAKKLYQTSQLSAGSEITCVDGSDVQLDQDVEDGKIRKTRSWSVVVREL